MICFRYNTPYSLVSEHSFYTPEGWLSYNLLLHKITIITSHNYGPFTPQTVLKTSCGESPSLYHLCRHQSLIKDDFDA